MAQKKIITPKDLGKSTEQLIHYDNLMPLSYPYDQPGMEPDWKDPKT
jgi:hypothetical protein